VPSQTHPLLSNAIIR
jgi:sensor domain CHASE-containing protein